MGNRKSGIKEFLVCKEKGKSTYEDVHKWMQNKAEASLFHKEDELVGIEGKKQMLMGWLMDEGKHQIVVSVVGMGGSEKTTLVARTFTDDIVKSHFECYAWITVSQSYVIEDLFRRLIKEFYQARKEEVKADLNSMSYRELLEILVKYLEAKRYLVVLDDVWDIKLWEEIRLSFPDKQLGSRVMLTTRREDIASSVFGVESHVHRIQPLETNDAWELFCMKAFSSYHNKSCSPELQPLAREIVEKCEGLPLAIVALSGLMSSKKTFSEWSQVCNSLNWHLANNSLREPMKSILLLKDYLIVNNKLIRLWIAEGFVEHVKGFTTEQVAESYLMELIFRSMIQERHYDTEPACKMHDLMRELALSIAAKEKFCAAYDGSEIITEEIGAIRLSIQTTNGEIEQRTGMSRLRSFLIFPTDIFSFSFSKTSPFEFKFLRVLDMEDVPVDILPDYVMYLFSLRYLSLRRTRIKELPESIGQLRNLQSLDIRETNIQALPRGISKLLNLRHLLMNRYTRDYKIFRNLIGMKAPSNINMLKLQALSFIESEGNILRLIGKMTQLTTLGITNVKAKDEKDLCASLQEMKVLCLLDLRAANEEEFLQVDALSSPPPLLDRLFLSGKLEKVPHWFCSLKSLTFLGLRWSKLEEDLLPHIEALPSLRWLCLNNSYVGTEMCFRRGFVTIEKGAMPNLEFLSIKRCSSLVALPQGYGFENVSEQLIESIQEGGADHPKVQHLRPKYKYKQEVQELKFLPIYTFDFSSWQLYVDDLSLRFGRYNEKFRTSKYLRFTKPLLKHNSFPNRRIIKAKQT
ncbi:NB-ARC domain-containing disease resistance protein [Prunus dulcis]|uniref:NB-ARC domain-containing disease resistance protein n=1 Tax=Prunus dulcis TaxID=3755 RepID=A0A4Y1RNU7_PRUDU|nr:NB-ARC domain-containing disease resistance protein [Prunus dulcis]